MKIIIVIPTFNEAENLPILADRIFANAIHDLSVLIVDDNSPDGCGKVADELHDQYGEQLKVVHRERREGLGRAYAQGFEAALAGDADVVGMMDADLSHPPEKLPEMINALGLADVVVGSRYVKGGSLDENWPFWRKGLSSFANLYTRKILSLPIKDTTGAYRLWHRSALESIPYAETRSSGYVFIVELAYLAALAGCKFTEVPIHFKEREHGVSKMSFKVQVEAALRVWQLRKIYRKEFAVKK